MPDPTIADRAATPALDGRELLAIRARAARVHTGQHQSLRQTEADREALVHEVDRLRKVVDLLGRNLQGSARAVTDVVVGAGIQREEMSRYLTDLVLAAENVEAEADAENRSSKSLAAMRRVLNTIPADALILDKPGEETP